MMNDNIQIIKLYENMSDESFIKDQYYNLVKLVFSLKRTNWVACLIDNNFINYKSRSNYILSKNGDNKDSALLALDEHIKNTISSIKNLQLPFEESDINEIMLWDKNTKDAHAFDTSLYKKYNLLVINNKKMNIKSTDEYELFLSENKRSFDILPLNINKSLRDLFNENVLKQNLIYIEEKLKEVLKSTPIIIDEAFFNEL